MLNKIITWARKENAIRSVVLTGSRAGNNVTDFFADYDVTLFVTDATVYLADNSWIHALEGVWIELADKICVPGQKEYHTRLVIFEGGIKVDFAFFLTDVLTNLAAQNDLVLRFACAYKVLLDKDELTKELSTSELKAPVAHKPSQQEFETVVKEFFFEAYHVAKYLYRNELWQVKFRDWETKKLLLRMIEWNEKAIHGWDYDTQHQGKHMKFWSNKETWKTLNSCFARFNDDEGSWKALMITVGLFRRVAKKTAEHLGYEYPVSVDENITSFLYEISARVWQKKHE